MIIGQESRTRHGFQHDIQVISRNVTSSSTTAPAASLLTPILIVGICLSVGSLVVLASWLLIREMLHSRNDPNEEGKASQILSVEPKGEDRLSKPLYRRSTSILSISQHSSEFFPRRQSEGSLCNYVFPRSPKDNSAASVDSDITCEVPEVIVTEPTHAKVRRTLISAIFIPSPRLSIVFPPSYGTSWRYIHTAFEPLLKDELAVSAGERVLVLGSFDDGWSTVQRMQFGMVEEGVIPTNCFTGRYVDRLSRSMRYSSVYEIWEESDVPEGGEIGQAL